MDTKITKFKWFWAWQDEREEAWLGEMSAAGLHLVTPGVAGFYTFTPGEPRNYVYRLDYQSVRKQNREEYLQLFRDAGWEYLGQMAQWQYFRKDAAGRGPNEIFTDAASKAGKYKRVIAYLGFLYVLFGVIFWSRFTTLEYGWADAVRWLMLAMLVFFTYALVKLALRIRKLQKR